MENGRMEVLRRLQDGEIDAQTALGLLREMEPASAATQAAETPAQPAEGEVITAAPTAAERPPKHWASFWLYPLAAAGAVLGLGVIILALVVGLAAAPGWQVCGWLPLTLGALGVLFALWSRSAKWLHIRVKEEGGKRIPISFPVPLTLTAWGLRIAAPFVPQLRETGIDELILALRDAKRDEPLHIKVDDPDGDQVEIYIG